MRGVKKGSKQSLEHKTKRLEAVRKYYREHPGINSGINNSNYGKKASPEVVENHKKKLLDGYRTGRLVAWNKGKKCPSISKGLKKAYQDENNGLNSQERFDKITKTIYKNTKPEIAVKYILDMYSIYNIQQKKVGKYIYDFYLPWYNILIEVDGVYWHSSDYAKAHDIIKTQNAKNKGYILIRVTDKELIKNSSGFFKSLFELIRRCEK